MHGPQGYIYQAASCSKRIIPPTQTYKRALELGPGKSLGNGICIIFQKVDVIFGYHCKMHSSLLKGNFLSVCIRGKQIWVTSDSMFQNGNRFMKFYSFTEQRKS